MVYPDGFKYAVRSAGGILPLSLLLFAYERALVPLYASTPTTFLLDKFLLCAALVAFINPIRLSKSSEWFLAGILLTLAPNVTYWVPVWTIRKWKDPYWGPAIVHAAVLVPLTLSYGTLVKPRSNVLLRATAGCVSCLGAIWARRLWANFVFLRDISDDQIFLVHAALAICVGIVHLHVTSSAPSTVKTTKGRKQTTTSSTYSSLQIKGLILAIFLSLWLSFSSKLQSPVLPHPYPPTSVEEPKILSKGPRRPAGLPFRHPSYPLIIHSSVQSDTGLIVVGEALENPNAEGSVPHAVRYLRAAHSILGGVWVGSNVRSLDDEAPMYDSRGKALGDSIYGTFVLQEAARLVNSTGKGSSTEDWKNALIIGLGTGISATAFARHRMSLTIVEIDPAVYDAARRYFGLPDPGVGNVFLEDARGWTAARSAEMESGKQGVFYDIVVHDCFSGGGVPEQLYSVEFWNDLKKIVRPTGIVAVNIAGQINSQATRLLLFTLESVFPRCRAFYDSLEKIPEEKYGDDFGNQVYFCTMSTESITFRTPTVKDYLGSLLTKHMLDTLPDREVNLDVLRESYEEDPDLTVLSDANNPLGRLQEEQGFEHWLQMRLISSTCPVMRQVLPDGFEYSFPVLAAYTFLMSDPQRISSPLGSSPSRTTSISRPAWPWSSASSSSLRHSHRSSTSSVASPVPGAGWERATASPAPSLAAGTGSMSKQNTGYSGNDESENTRQWTYMGFEWAVRNASKLRDFIEGVGSGAVDGSSEDSRNVNVDFEVLKLSPILGDNKFKLEIVPTPSNDGEPNAKTPGLSLYVTSLMMDYAHAEYEMSASMMAAIKCQDDRLGQRGARPDFIWEHWQGSWSFRQDSEFWACSLPSLSSLLENPRIQETDSFVICIQIHCPIGPFFPSQPSVYYVPRDLLDGLEASLDNPNTGDVRFVCLERWRPDEQNSPLLSPDAISPSTRRPPSSASSYSPFAAEMIARKRIIYAHSDILTRRSEYFATMLTSSFSENQAIMHGERKIFTIVVEEADFETIYWLLKYCYANWLLFKEVDDPRVAVEGVGAGWSASWLHSRSGEWDWKTFNKHGLADDSPSGDARSAASGDSVCSNVKDTSIWPKSSIQSYIYETTTSRVTSSGSTPKGTSNNATSSRNLTSSTGPSTPRRPTQAPASGSHMSLKMPASPSAARTKPIPLSVANSNFSTPSHYPVSPHTNRPRVSSNQAPDPHQHPTPPPAPASPLSMYQVAHRYVMPALQVLALEHMMSTITPQSSFALLLATTAWEDLHNMVEDYVVDKWDEVSVSPEFEQCCQEVAGGEWGAEGGKTMTALFRRLRSPTALMYKLLRMVASPRRSSTLSLTNKNELLSSGSLQRPSPMFCVRATFLQSSRLQKRGLATIADNFRIPVINFAQFRTAKSDSEKKATANDIVSAFKESGFIYVEGHGIPTDASKSAEFFKLPTETKQKLAWEDPHSNRGYVQVGRERVTQAVDAAEIASLREKAPDFKESMEIGRDWDSEWKNMWPSETDAPGFKSTMLDFFQTCHNLQVEMMRSIALGLDLQEDFFDKKIDKQCHNLRLLSYPPMKRSLLDSDGQARAGAHSDYGTLTLLFQDMVGGLEVKNPHTGNFIPATPIPGTIVINVGDLLARWSNDVLRSTLHRVVAPPAKKINETEAITPARQSIAFFSNPNFDAEIECLPNCGSPAKYPSVNTEKYIVGRLAATYM
ncbi:hypothetical protein D9758_004807 [Tetrapyrgos nigripes]|uniref:Fe2OG dioxygenase domain-containing protein n=1 Tax=Tetrapyrgos nigripes TaxID=182062 RepID=A0A8H5G5Q8_9AGAR|nr:hypothetical protein D9758_004807 [Tetrapyrgos nigripes]